MNFKRIGISLALFVASVAALAQPVTITVLHTNDLHARVEPVIMEGKGYGGYARHVTLIRQLREKDQNVLLLSGGDSFQGTLYFNVYEGAADLFFMNLKGYTGMAVGNHEFDRGPKPLGVFAGHAKFPVLAANLDVDEDPDLRDVIKKHATVEVGGHRVGLVGAVTPDLPFISSIGPHVKMLDLIPSIQQSVAALQAEGVNKIFLLSHLGYQLEQEVASKVRGIDVIVGGHSHSLLGSFEGRGFPEPEGPYPTVVKNPEGGNTLVVQAWEWGKLLGRIKVHFDAEGRVESWSEAQPIVVDESIPEDPVALSAIIAMAKPIETLRRSVVAHAPADVDGSRETVRRQESPMANIIADSFLSWGATAQADLALINGGGVRGGLNAGQVTYENVISVQPFNNTLELIVLTGEELWQAFEYGLSGLEAGEGRFLHPSRNVRYTYDSRKPVGQRLLSVEIDGKPLDKTRSYRIMMNHFMAEGGDGFAVFKNAKDRLETGILDIDVLIEFLKANPNVNTKPEGRIVDVAKPRLLVLLLAA
jgi:5'-nucleotidase / UDP-sugar diphosphatase